MVEWKAIEDMGSYFGGLTGKTKKDFENGNAKFITYMNVFANPSLNPSVDGVVKIRQGEKQNKVQKGDILFTGSSETPDEAGMSCVVADELEEDYYMNSFCFGLRLLNPEQFNLHYLKHLLRSESVRKSIAKTASGVTRFNISKSRFGKIQIPIPSLSEQQRIVEQLDTFTSSIENLKEQIAQRRKQYEYYRDQLLDLEGKEGVEMKTLGEVVSKECSLSYGIVQPGDDVPNGIPVVRPIDLVSMFVEKEGLKKTTKEISDSYKRTILKGNEILFCVRGTTGVMSLASEMLKDCNVTRGIVPITIDDKITKMFVYYQLKGLRLQKTIAEKTNGTALRQINVKDLRLLSLMLPPLSEQQRIVSILDTFEASIHNLEQQLAQREKQYEYYRNKLLTFE